MGADLAYVGSAFIATAEANAAGDYKRMIVDSAADDVVYTSLFTGVLGNYLTPSVAAQCLDPDDLPNSDPSAMRPAGGSSQPKRSSVIRGPRPGLGPGRAVVPPAALTDTLERESRAALHRLRSRTSPETLAE